ncbi:TIGR02679 domain-containing protein [Streptomyces sp. BRA346]|uniref:TIGR02679 domain-containing protein n=1 Tax=Streptomyces sp. BRA346 TaxID=2878199 RepID=UPI004063949A
MPLVWSSPERRTKARKQTLAALNTQERNDLSLLLGKPLTGATVTVRLDVLDSQPCASAIGLGLRDTLEELGPPLTDRRAARADATARREQVWSSLTSSLDASPLVGQEWPRRWHDLLRRAGPEGSDARCGDLDTPDVGASAPCWALGAIWEPTRSPSPFRTARDHLSPPP